jgi:diaminopimelate decarboxylase
MTTRPSPQPAPFEDAERVNRTAEIAGAVGTPFYLYDGDILQARIEEFEAAFDGLPHQTCYAVKANDALALIALAGRAGLGTDIVSGGELAKALRAGIRADRIVFSGVGKRREEIRAAIDAEIRSLNVESLGELDVVAEEARAAARRVPVAVRLNPNVAADTHAYVATGSAQSKFGLGFEEALAALERAAQEKALEPIGISFHIGSQLFDLAQIKAAVERASELWAAARERGIVLRDLDAGGGLGVRYEGGEPIDLEAYASVLAKASARLDAELVLEPGRWLVAPAGTFVTRVLYVKNVPGRCIAVCDGGMNDLIRPALYSAYHPIEIVAGGERKRGLVDVVGPVCESGDFFALGRELALPEPGDLLTVGLAGAYCRVMSSTYNARPLCAEVLVEGGAWHVIREHGSVADLVRGERLQAQERTQG